MKKQLKLSKAKYFADVCKEAAGQASKMWSAVNSALGRNYRKKIRNEGCEKTSSQVIAEEFNTYFSNCAKESNKDNSGKGHSIPSLPKAPTVFHFKRID